MSNKLHSPNVETGKANVQVDIAFARRLLSLFPTLIAQATYEFPALNTLSIDPVTIIRGLVVAGRATEVTIVNTKDVPANDSVVVNEIVKSEGDFIYLGWLESWDVETENVVKFEEFVDKNVTESGASLTIDKLTTSDEAPREVFVSFLTKPIKDSVHIKFTNSSGTQVWAKHTWQGIKIKKQDYLDYIWAHFKKILDSYRPVEELVL